MRKYVIYAFIIILFLPGQINGQNQIQTSDEEILYPQIPRVTAYEAYLKYKEGKAIIFHAGGMHYSKRHIFGAFNLDVEDELKDERLKKFPANPNVFKYTYHY